MEANLMHFKEVILTNVPEGYQNEFILLKLNELFSDVYFATRIRKFPTKENTSFIRVRCRNLNTYDKLLNNGFKLDNRLYRAVLPKKNNATSRRCYNCQQINASHLKYTCCNPRKCVRCAQNHDVNMCTAEKPFCANCQMDHQADSPTCPSWQKATEKRKRQMTPASQDDMQSLLTDIKTFHDVTNNTLYELREVVKSQTKEISELKSLITSTLPVISRDDETSTTSPLSPPTKRGRVETSVEYPRNADSESEQNVLNQTNLLTPSPKSTNDIETLEPNQLTFESDGWDSDMNTSVHNQLEKNEENEISEQVSLPRASTPPPVTPLPMMTSVSDENDTQRSANAKRREQLLKDYYYNIGYGVNEWAEQQYLKLLDQCENTFELLYKMTGYNPKSLDSDSYLDFNTSDHIELFKLHCSTIELDLPAEKWNALNKSVAIVLRSLLNDTDQWPTHPSSQIPECVRTWLEQLKYITYWIVDKNYPI